MIIKTVRDDILNSEAKHIAFAINTEGHNGSGFAGKVSKKYWPELANCGYYNIGTVLSKTVGDKTFHALVCYSLRHGWGEVQAEDIKLCFDNIPVNDEVIATIAIGKGFIGLMSGANVRQIICGIHDSNKQIMLHAKYTLEDIIKCYNEEKGAVKKRK